MYTLTINHTEERKTVQCADLASAREAWLESRDAEYPTSTGIGGSAMRKGCGDIKAGGEIVAHVSYNGRLWTGIGPNKDFSNKIEVA